MKAWVMWTWPARAWPAATAAAGPRRARRRRLPAVCEEERSGADERPEERSRHLFLNWRRGMALSFGAEQSPWRASMISTAGAAPADGGWEAAAGAEAGAAPAAVDGAPVAAPVGLGWRAKKLGES